MIMRAIYDNGTDYVWSDMKGENTAKGCRPNDIRIFELYTDSMKFLHRVYVETDQKLIFTRVTLLKPFIQDRRVFYKVGIIENGKPSFVVLDENYSTIHCTRWREIPFDEVKPLAEKLGILTV